MAAPSTPLRRPAVHYAWVVVALTFVTTLVGAGVRSASSVLIHPLESEFGWSRAAIASAIGMSLLVYGVAAPISGKLVDRFGPRRVLAGSLVLLTAGLLGTLVMRSVWHLTLLWGVIIGLGAGGTGNVVPAAVANRWFAARRGLALGILNSSVSTGQLIFLPLLMSLIVSAGWRVGILLLVVSALALVPALLLWMRNSPEEAGLLPYGVEAVEKAAPVGGAASVRVAAAGRAVPLLAAVRTPTFWLLAAAFFVCGGTSSGLVGTHLIPHSIDHGIPEVTAAATVGVMGAMNFVGTLLSGWLTDRIDPRKILAVAFGLRGLSLFVLPFVRDFAGLLVFAVIYGLDWFATVPPVVTLIADTYGKRSVGSLYGWVFLSHQIGSAIAAAGSGTLRVWMGDYRLAFLIGGILATVSAGLSMGIPRRAAAATAGAQGAGAGQGLRRRAATGAGPVAGQ